MWFVKALTERARKLRNIDRLQDLYQYLKELKDMSPSCQSCAFDVISQLKDLNLVKGRPKLKEKIQEAYMGENNQKVALDAPIRFSRLIQEAMDIVKYEIASENREKEQHKKGLVRKREQRDKNENGQRNNGNYE